MTRYRKPENAIKAYCIECSGGSKREVERDGME